MKLNKKQRISARHVITFAYFYPEAAIFVSRVHGNPEMRIKKMASSILFKVIFLLKLMFLEYSSAANIFC